ncbi:MAG: hypothetical protein ABL929_07055 [Ferruginibacter sp.]|nr:hypothetical protein [Ferruginibacter sp.]
MAACNFSVTFSKPAEEILAKAKETVESQQGTFIGDNSAGRFDVSVFGNTIVGTYSVVEQILNIDIIEKPFMVPCSMIESFLTSKLN